MKREGLYLLASVLIIGIFVLSGCGQKCPETPCNDNNPCTSDSCDKETGYACAFKPLPGCHIGNGKCEPSLGETRCNATADCGNCDNRGMNITSKYLTANCTTTEKDVCSVLVKESEITKEPYASTQKFDNIELQIIMNMERPFDVDSALIEVETELLSLPATVTDFTITQIQLLATYNRKEILLGETRVDKTLFETGGKTKDEIRFSYVFNSPELSLSDVQIKVYYAYNKKVEGRADQLVASSIKYVGPSPLTFLNPTEEITCAMLDCNDYNTATLDTCRQERDIAYCRHERLPNVCGNFKCEPESPAKAENKCTCPFDCGTCEKNYGTYLEYVCVLDQCISQIKGSPLTKTFANEKAADYFTINVETSLNQPFKVNSRTESKSDKVKLVVRLMDAKGTTSAWLSTAPKFNMIEIYRSKEILGKAVFTSGNQLGGSNKLTVGTYVTFEIPLSFIMASLEQKMSISPKLYYEYVYTEKYYEQGIEKTRDVLKRDSYSFDVADLDFVNPDR